MWLCLVYDFIVLDLCLTHVLTEALVDAFLESNAVSPNDNTQSCTLGSLQAWVTQYVQQEIDQEILSDVSALLQTYIDKTTFAWSLDWTGTEKESSLIQAYNGLWDSVLYMQNKTVYAPVQMLPYAVRSDTAYLSMHDVNNTHSYRHRCVGPVILAYKAVSSDARTCTCACSLRTAMHAIMHHQCTANYTQLYRHCCNGQPSWYVWLGSVVSCECVRALHTESRVHMPLPGCDACADTRTHHALMNYRRTDTRSVRTHARTATTTMTPAYICACPADDLLSPSASHAAVRDHRQLQRHVRRMRRIKPAEERYSAARQHQRGSGHHKLGYQYSRF